MRGHRSASIGGLAAIAAGLCAGPVAADPPKPVAAATLQCERVSEPGRVKCAVEIRVTEGRSISWADVVILELPPFATALKGRIGPTDATSHDAVSQRWAFGLVAKKAGQGEARVRVRAIVCDAPVAADAAASRCAPATLEVKALVEVG